MKRQTLLWSILVLLFVMNIATLGLFLFLKKEMHYRPHGNPAFDRSVISTLQLNEDQIRRFNELKAQHHRQMVTIDEAMREPFTSYFSYLTKEGDNTAALQILENSIDSMFRLKIRYTFRHFEELKSICKPEQKSKFERLVPQLMQVMQPPPPDRMPPPEQP